MVGEIPCWENISPKISLSIWSELTSGRGRVEMRVIIRDRAAIFTFSPSSPSMAEAYEYESRMICTMAVISGGSSWARRYY